MERILIVEDSRLYQKVIQRELQQLFPAVEFFFAGNGVEGLKMYAEVRPDVVFFDLLMPAMNGDEMYRELKALDPKVRGITISADVQRMIQEELRAAGVLGFIAKPFTKERAKEAYAILKGL